VKKIAWVVGLVLVARFLAELPGERIRRGQNDFLAFYAGASLVGTGDLYSASAMKTLQLREAAIHLPSVLYIRPDFYAALLKPLALLSFQNAYLLFQSLNLAALLFFLHRFRARSRILWMAPISIPIWLCFANGQDLLLFLSLLSLAWLALGRQKDFLAGFILALATFKPHFLVFLPIVLAFHRRWGAILGGLTGLSTLYCLAACWEGPGWLFRFFAAIRQPEIHPAPFGFLNLRGITTAFSLDPLWLIPLTLLFAAIFIWILWSVRNLPLNHGFTLALLAALLLSFHLGMHDCALLLLIAAIAPIQTPLESGALALSYPLVYWLLLFDGWLSALPALAAFALLAYQFLSIKKPLLSSK
jgi:hypothetical protein